MTCRSSLLTPDSSLLRNIERELDCPNAGLHGHDLRLALLDFIAPGDEQMADELLDQAELRKNDFFHGREVTTLAPAPSDEFVNFFNADFYRPAWNLLHEREEKTVPIVPMVPARSARSSIPDTSGTASFKRLERLEQEG